MATGSRRGRPKGSKNTSQATMAGAEQEQVQDTGSSEEIPIVPPVASAPELQEGIDPGDLFASDEEKSLEIFNKGKKWIFKYKDLTWGDKNKCLDDAQQWKDGEFQFSISKYYSVALTRMLTQTPVRPITETTLMKLDRFVGEQLTSIVPQPMETPPDTEAVKKA